MQKQNVHLKWGVVFDVLFDYENVPVKLNVIKYVFIRSLQLYEKCGSLTLVGQKTSFNYW